MKLVYNTYVRTSAQTCIVPFSLCEGNGSFSVIELKPIKRQTMSEVVARRVIDVISSGTLKPGDRLPPERDLAAQLQVSRTTVREALKLLTLVGLLEAHRGSGTYVTREYSNFVANSIEWPVLLGADEVDQIVEVREPLELQAARLAAKRANDQDLERIAVYEGLKEIQGRDIERETEIDLAFHEAVAVASHNELLVRLMLSLQTILEQYILQSMRMTEDKNSTFDEHESIHKAILARDPEAAACAMAEHLAISKRLARVLDA